MISKLLPRFGKFAVLIALVTIISTSLCFAANFTATTSMKQGGMTMYGKLYVKGDNMRQEINMGGKKQVIICRTDKKLTWLVDDSQKCYTEVPGVKNERTIYNDLKKKGNEKYLGKETVNGYSCKKYKYTMPGQYAGTIFQWRSDKLNWPIKTEMKQEGKSFVIEYKNIKEVKPADSLFELPKGYKKKALGANNNSPRPMKPKAPSAAKQPRK